jgi:membrane-bound lytic murein transglycosylase B
MAFTDLAALSKTRWQMVGAVAFVVLILLGPHNMLAADPLFANLQKRLIDDGLDADLVQSIYRHPQTKLEFEVVAGNLVRSEAALNYDQFLSAYSVRKAEGYLQRYERTLREVEKHFGVNPEVVVAVLMVETALGTYPGRYRTINVLSTMAAADDHEIREQILTGLTVEQRKMQSAEVISKRLRKRAGRSYRELKALIAYVSNNALDPFAIVGSSEGAIGIPQFLPSNIEQYGKDGDGDGRIDLFNHHDAIASVAFYLRAHHWGRAKSAEGKKRVLFHYNHSNYYVDTVYSLALRLNGNKPL